MSDPATVRALVDRSAAGRGTDEPQVAASLFVQAYAFRIPSVALGAYALGLPTPSVATAHTAFGMARHRPATVAYLDDTLHPDGSYAAERLAGQTVEHLSRLIGAVRATTTIGERLLWGNVTASCATTLRAVEGAVDPDRRLEVRARGERLLAADAAFAGLGNFTTSEDWRFRRTTCCLWYRTTPPGEPSRYCDDCSLRSPA